MRRRVLRRRGGGWGGGGGAGGGAGGLGRGARRRLELVGGGLACYDLEAVVAADADSAAGLVVLEAGEVVLEDL